MSILTSVVLLLFAVTYSSALYDSISDRYDFQLNLTFPQQPGAAPFKFFYTYDRDNQLLKMAVQVLSLGWVGIGFSSNQVMPDTDVAIGWVDDSGRGFLQVNCVDCTYIASWTANKLHVGHIACHKTA